MDLCKIYLAAPFFNDQQVRVVADIETCLRGLGHEVFSPREGAKLGDSLGKTMAERRAAAKEIFDRNVYSMIAADYCVAVVDGHDAGTMFEIGYCFRNRTPIVSYTELNKGLNIMIQECVAAHVKGLSQLDDLFAGRRPFSDFQDFDKDMI